MLEATSLLHVYSPGITINDAGDLSLMEYFVPWSRYQSYGIGVLTGCVLWELKDKQVTLPVVSKYTRNL